MPLYPPGPSSGSGTTAASGGPASSSTTQVGGVNAGNLVVLSVDSAGHLFTDLLDGIGNAITSQANGGQRALDVGVNVAGVQIDPRLIRALTSADVVTVTQATGTNLHTVVDSGTLTATQATAANLNATVVGTVTSNQGIANIVVNAWPHKITDGINVSAVKAASTAAVAADPSLVVSISPNLPITYSASVTNLKIAAAATDVFTISGSATKTIRITRVTINGSTSTANTTTILLIKRSSTATGGTSTATIAVPMDSTNSTATAIMAQYTANPTTVGTSVGTLYSGQLYFSTVTSGTRTDNMEWAAVRPSQSIILRGTTQFLAVNFNSTTIALPAVNINVEWIEE